MPTAQEMVEAQRARHRARYLLSKAGGEGVPPGDAPADPNPTPPAQKMFPMDPAPAPVSSPAPDQPHAYGHAQEQGEVDIDILSQGSAVERSETGVGVSILAPAREGVPQPINIQELGELVRALRGQVTTYSPEAREALAQLDAAFAPAAPEPVLTQPALPVGWDDPSMVWKGKVIKALGRNKWLFKPFKLSLRPEGALHVRNNILMKAGWTVWTQDNPYTDQGGYVLFGEYNRYGERLK